MEKRSILIFGAGINQLELIREAKKIGVTAVTIDPAVDPPGRKESDYHYQVKPDDYISTREIAVKHRINGIVTGQMEKPLRLMARLASEMGYFFHSPEVTERCIDKWLMKQTFLDHSIPCAKGFLLKSHDKLSNELPEGLSFPLIIKPKDSFSSRGVYKTNSISEIVKYLPESQSYSSNGDVIIEEFLEGKEYSVETITFQGQTSVIQYTEKFITPYPNTVELGHFQPADLNESQQKIISTAVIQAIDALGIDNSAAHTEVMLKDDKVWIIETGARLGGDFISSYLTKASTGVSMDRAAIHVALGEKPDTQHTCCDYSLVKYLNLPVQKKVIRIAPITDLCSKPYLIFLKIFISPGEMVLPIIHSAMRPACFIIKSKSKTELMSLANHTESSLLNKIILQ